VVDEQTKAEEEFKKSLYGSAADGTSSDEEETSKTKKLHIRIRDKPVTSATVDVNKIKEATKQLGLPISRTKSLTSSSPELSLLVPQPSSATNGLVTAPVVSTSADPFGTNSLTQSASMPNLAPKAVGAGVAAGPIPEDFFQNTISSVQVAASLPPPGTYLSKLDQNSQVAEATKMQPSQGSASAVDVGLPDGGDPPQPFMQPSGLHPHVQMSKPPVSNQPLDLSSLEAPGSGQPSARPSSPPKAVRPGQVSFLFHTFKLLGNSWYQTMINSCFILNLSGSLVIMGRLMVIINNFVFSMCKC